MESESFENLKVGDRVFYDSQSATAIYTIARLTQTQIILKNGQRFRKEDGWLVGGDTWATTAIRILTPARIEAFTLLKLRREAIRLRDNLTIPLDKETLEKLIKALKPFVKDKS
jgi:hypothetical protein